MRVLSGMQPSGNPHLGNYLGAMKQHIELQNQHEECFYFIANYHALTTVRDPEKLREMTFELAVDYLALGLDPQKSVFFRQSDVPEHTELAWILECITPMGMLERAHAWKDAVKKGKKESSVGLFNYPVLMAVDILMYHPHIVPVGKDQKQHVEIARDIAQRFNKTFGETFTLPEALIKENVATVPGIDGEKMSKSYGNTIDIFAPENILKKQVMSIITDSATVEEKKNLEKNIIFQLYSLLAKQEEIKKLREKFLNGGFGYGDSKKMLFEKIMDEFHTPREKREKLMQERNYVESVLSEGGKKAKALAIKTTEEVRKKVGLD
ncbi:tryptophan--tRNA ligase [Candidatus Peregrinibacteria bacterium]|nr:tryptophan--tRNA ligase [Candidatus Peregrinibacteria bacterium]